RIGPPLRQMPAGRIASAASRLATCADAGVLSVHLSSEWSALPRYAWVPNGTSRPSHWQIPSRAAKLEIADEHVRCNLAVAMPKLSLNSLPRSKFSEAFCHVVRAFGIHPQFV